MGGFEGGGGTIGFVTPLVGDFDGLAGRFGADGEAEPSRRSTIAHRGHGAYHASQCRTCPQDRMSAHAPAERSQMARK
jgi:hypothetical protein